MRRRAAPVVAAVLALGASQPARGPAWFSARHVRDLTGDGRPDTLLLDAYGRRPERLDVVLRVRGGGRELFRDAWNTSDEFREELASPPAERPSADSLARRVRTELGAFFAADRFGSAAALPFGTTWPPITSDCDGDPRDCMAFHLRYERAKRGAAEPSMAAIDRAPFDTALVRRAADEMRRRALPTFTFSYGYETTRVITWSPAAARFFVVSECC